jgi:hypothetical protein
MARLLTFPAQVRKRGNPSWCRGARPILDLPTKFDKEVERLRLTEESYAKSQQLRVWRQRHRDQCYIPERLLKAWGLIVDTWEDPTINTKSRAA